MDNRENINLLRKFYAGTSSEEENKRLVAWLGSTPQDELDRIFRNVWDESGFDISENEKRRMREGIIARLESERKTPEAERPVHGKNKRLFSFLKWAAAIVIITVTGFIGYRTGNSQGRVETFTACTEKGQKSKVVLPDGSIVWLNCETTIKYGSDYARKERRIRLVGEAFFEVAKNKDCPFVVTTGKVSVQAVGTQFDVRAYSDEDEITTTLIKGKVRAWSSDADLFLMPGERITYSKSSDGFGTKVLLGEDYGMPWRNGQMMFERSSLDEIAKDLERYYGVSVVFTDDGIRNIRYTGRITNTALENVLDLITITSDVDYTIINDTITFDVKKK
jgi:ferric-dicitrate binding protein FerR (iron transport regulator)